VTDQKTVEIVVPSSILKQVPQKFEEYVNGKLMQKEQGGRPHFVKLLGNKGLDPDEKDEQKALIQMRKHAIEELLNICEASWIKDRSLANVAHDYKLKGKTLYRLLKEMEPFKQEICDYIRTVPRRKRWYIPELEISDYENVQNYINRAKRDGLKRYRDMIIAAEHVWSAMKYRDPAYWTADEICSHLASLSPGSQSHTLDAIRQVAPQIAIKGSRDQVQTGRFREKLSRRKKDLFGAEINLIHKALEPYPELKTKFDLHITTGAREGQRDSTSGLTGLTWEKFKNGFTRLDLYESKVRGGINWRDCPLDLFFMDLPERLKALWTARGKPTSDKVFLNGYKEVLNTYTQIREILKTAYEGKVDPSLLKEFITLRPHDADKIHVNLLWEAEIPLEVVAGQYVGNSEGIGLMGRGWLDVNVIKKHYLSLTSRSERMQKLQNQVRVYSQRFNGHDVPTEAPIEA
jgi:hypothetical protein